MQRQGTGRDIGKQKLHFMLPMNKCILPGRFNNVFSKDAPNLKGYDLAGVTESAGETGGDYYDFIPMSGDYGLVVGDVTGHGIGPALLMAETRAYLKFWLRTLMM